MRNDALELPKDTGHHTLYHSNGMQKDVEQVVRHCRSETCFDRKS